MKDIADADYAKQYTDWHVKTGGFARDIALRDYFAGLAMQGLLATGADYEDDIHGSGWNWVATAAYKMADAMLKERAK
jgi:hypothetical protein